ncbi:MAG: hypothetical protein DHS20C17_32090 [Cyclobacteriaceae bacterium]|nr:MAG: hypothetical protein DHS20C17_32090 [Cyclobacteriaceae bacterium]
MKQLSTIIDDALDQFERISSEEWVHKSSPDKWSRKEILGHLVDSARINLQRFNEIQYFDSPYQIAPYDQDRQVITNAYQKESIDLIKTLWQTLNHHISFVISIQPEVNLSRQVVLLDGSIKHMQWLFDDYVDHLQHHLNQILHNIPNANETQ